MSDDPRLVSENDLARLSYPPRACYLALDVRGYGPPKILCVEGESYVIGFDAPAALLPITEGRLRIDRDGLAALVQAAMGAGR